MRASFDVAVVGSGFGGSLAALVARRLGKSVVLLERGRHPRFAIGESSSPLANLLLEELARRYDLPRLLPLARWGSWRRAYPEIGCGLKRGFTFLAHERGRRFAGRADRADQLLVAASPRDEIADTHWLRADLDAFLVREAQAAGAVYVDEARLDSARPEAGGIELDGARGSGETISLRARFVVDASGPGGFLVRALGLPRAAFPALPPTQGLYTHFEGVRRLDAMSLFPWDGAPYPPDDAAVHHVFPGGWIWVLRFANGVTSAGVAATERLAEELRLAEGGAGWERLLALFPTVRAQLENARPVLPFVHAPRLSFRAGVAAGPAWALLPFAAAFVDPLLSTGFPLTLLGVERLGRLMERHELPPPPDALSAYGRATLADADAAGRLVAALYARFDDFPGFAALTKLYFAAASFAESARRLGRPDLAGGFLCAEHPAFGPDLRRLCEAAVGTAPPSRERLESDVLAAIAPIDVAGLGDVSRRGWYPVLASDLVTARETLGATREEIALLLRRSGFETAAAIA